MSLFSRIGELFGKKDAEEAPLYSESSRLTLRSMRGDEILEVKGNARIRISTDEEKEILSLNIRNGNSGTYQEVTRFHLPENARDRRELLDMLDIVREDISDALEKGIGELRIPTNEYDLYMYIKRRPSIPLNMDELEKELDNGELGIIGRNFQMELNRNKRLDVYVVPNCLSNVVAMQILKNSWKDYPMIHFKELESPQGDNGYLFWSSPMIQDMLKKEYNIAIINIGVMGKKPPYCLELKTDKNSSIIQKASILSGHQMNVREEMINSQSSFHAAGINYICKRRDIRNIDKILKDLAVEEAAYRMPREIAEEIAINILETIKKARKSLPILQISQFDKDLILNLVVRSEEGFLVEINGQEMLYYSDYTGKLQDLYGWIYIEEKWYQSPYDVTVSELEEEARLVHLEGRFIREMDETLRENVGTSVIASFENVMELVKRYEKEGLNAVHQTELLEYVDAIKSYGYGDSIENMINEILR